MVIPDPSVEEEGNLYFSIRLPNEYLLCIAPLTDEEASAVGLCPEERGGYFLYRQCEANLTEIEIIARVVSSDAALVLCQLLKME
jgi:hypothetical protein